MNLRNGSILAVLCLALAGAAALMAGDFWEERPYDTWTQAEVRIVITRSPWAQEIKTGGIRSGDWGGLSRSESGGAGATDIGSPTSVNPSAPGGSYPSRTGAVGADSDAEADRNRRGVASSYYVLWSSSETVRRALARNQLLMGMASPEQVQRALDAPAPTYSVTILGADLSIFEGRTPDDLKTACTLETKTGKQTLSPTDVRITRSGGTEQIASVTFDFPKQIEGGQAAIQEGEKRVEFSLKLKDPDLRIKANFEPKRMKLDGKADL